MTGTDGNLPDVAALLQNVIMETLPGLDVTEIVGSVHLKDLGADSIDRIEILMGILDRLGLSSPLSRFSDVKNIGELTAVLSRLQRHGGN